MSENNSQNTDKKATKEKPPLISVRRGGGRISKLAQLDDESYSQMIQYVRLGCYDWVAAQSIRITPETFARWMRIGSTSKKKKDAEYRQFYTDVSQARAYARMIAEVNVKKDSPSTWLRCGPGRTKPNLPGWTDEIHVHHEGEVLHDHSGSIEHEMKAAISAPTLAAMLGAFEQLGMIQKTDAGLVLFNEASVVKDAEITDEEQELLDNME